MRILILGGTGFVGTPLAAALRTAGHTVFSCSRRGAGPHAASGPLAAHKPCDMSDDAAESAAGGRSVPRCGGGLVAWDGRDAARLGELLRGMDAVINLQGENIGARRWTAERRNVILQSRVQAGEALTQALVHMRQSGEKPPHTLVQASACGYYGLWTKNAPPCPEDSPQGQGFLADVCGQWEASTAPVEILGVRRCVLRLSPVLGRDGHGGAGGFVGRMAGPWRYYLGGPAGPGTQPMSWVHIHDVIGAVNLTLDRPDLRGVFNVCAPTCPDMNEFSRTLGRVLHRPSWLRTPAPLLRLVLGRMADELVLAGQHPLPARLMAAGFVWQWPVLKGALRHVLDQGATRPVLNQGA